MDTRPIPSRWPGIAATALLVVATSLWTFWGIAELYWEGWGLPFPQPLYYLAPAAIMLTLSLLALRFPVFGGLVVFASGIGFTWWWWTLMYRRGANMAMAILTTIPVSAILVLVGILFLFEARRQRRLKVAGAAPPSRWILRNLRYVIVVGLPLLIVAVVTAMQLPALLSRFDDGIRSARVVEGNGVTLEWAPAGLGWNWKQPAGWILSWDHLATYGMGAPGLKTLRVIDGRTMWKEPSVPADSGTGDGAWRSMPGGMAHASAADMNATGLCGYLTEDGRSLADHRLGIWRMPTADEMVRSLTREGNNAGCAWKGQAGFSTCRERPDKETPLWAPDQSPIYYWAADERSADLAWYVAYNGAVQSQPKNFGNPRHGYRCVRERR